MIHRLPTWWLLLLAATASLRAAPADQAVVAAMKIVDTRNYSWTCYVPSTGRALVVREGKANKDGFSMVTFVDPQSPMMRQIARLNDGTVIAFFRGEGNFVFQTSDGWKTGEELPPLGLRRRGAKGGADYWLSVPSPHEELEIIVGSYQDMKLVDGALQGSLSDDGARQLLGSSKTPAVTATGSFKLWVEDGVLTKYLVDLTGTIMTGAPGADAESTPLRRLMLTEIKDVGKTKLDVPDEVRRKLSP